jgi:hypothetical protein
MRIAEGELTALSAIFLIMRRVRDAPIFDYAQV